MFMAGVFIDICLFYLVKSWQIKEATMIFKDKEILSSLSMIEKKVDMLIAMQKTDKLRKASEKAKKGECKYGK